MASFKVLTNEELAALSPRDAKQYFFVTPEEMRDANISVEDHRIFNGQLAAKVKEVQEKSQGKSWQRY